MLKLPIYDDLNPQQLSVLEHPINKSLFVAGPPGSGKTVLAIYRAQIISEANNTVAIITYNRMLRRLITILNKKSGSTATMHKFVYHDYKNRTGVQPIYYRYNYDWQNMISTVQKSGYGKQYFDHIIIDEGQDLPEGFFSYISQHAAQTLTIFADEDQAIEYQRTTLKEIKLATRLSDPIILKDNHRNSKEIALLAEHFHSGILPAATVKRKITGQKPKLIKSSDLDYTASRISTWLINRAGTVGVIVKYNSTGLELYDKIKKLIGTRRVDIYTENLKNEDSIDMMSPGITILNQKSVKGQEFDATFIIELEYFIPCKDDTMKRIMYMLCTRARDNLFLIYGPHTLPASSQSSLPNNNILEHE